MNLEEFISNVTAFDLIRSRAKIIHFAWYLHTSRQVDVLNNELIRECFRTLHLQVPDLSVYLPRMAAAKPPDLLRVRGGYKLAGPVRRSLDAKYGVNQSTIVVTRLLSDLPRKMPNLAERTFLSEAIDCYRVKAYRAAIVMAWNLTFDHILQWILSENGRVDRFNVAIQAAYPKKSGRKIRSRDDFEALKEYEVVEVCRVARLFSKSVAEILREKLKRRNIAAHPSEIVVTQAQADDTITDLVNNVVLSLR